MEGGYFGCLGPGTPPIRDEKISKREMAKQLGVSRGTVDRALEAGRPPSMSGNRPVRPLMHTRRANARYSRARHGRPAELFVRDRDAMRPLTPWRPTSRSAATSGCHETTTCGSSSTTIPWTLASSSKS